MDYNELYNGNPVPDIHAKMYLMSPEDGGRKTPIYIHACTYDPQFQRVGLQYSTHGVNIRFFDRHKETGIGGELIDIYLYFYRPIFQTGNLFEGLHFHLKEGTKIVATATITRVLNPEMLYWHPKTLLNSLREKGLKNLSETTKTNLKREFDKILALSDINYANPNKNKKAIFDVNLTGFYNDKVYLTDLAPQLFAIWQEKFNLGEEKHKFYYLDKEKSRQVIFEFVTWNDTHYVSCCLVLQSSK